MLWPQKDYEPWKSLLTLCCGYSHTAHGSGLHPNPSWGTHTFVWAMPEEAWSPALLHKWKTYATASCPPLTPSLLLCAPECISWMSQLSWLISCFACGCWWTLTSAWCVQTLWDRHQAEPQLLLSCGAAPLSLLPGILGSCFEIKQLWVCI